MAAAESRNGIKLTARSIAEYRHVIPCLKDSEGRKVKSPLGMEAAIEEYYERLLHSSMTTAPARLLTERLGDTLPFTPSEVRQAAELMPSGKCSGEDKLVVKDVRACGHPLYVALAERFTRYVEELRVPTAWKTSNTVLLHKKGEKEDLGNYRPISLLPVLYKVFTRCLLARIRRTL
ncbi:hypothetical protein Y032_0145g2508 [Ancylostoma ceylanicum]|uniref:Reverse transcriptase domain-containing protein n=1 Tax=Ancylostoma ceylanicum TaxID=53326 RepID=A0A016T1S9_9BILA|nr:hypothetical protein Y032_0145g2508 [Ancylostoma ceylanicum]